MLLTIRTTREPATDLGYLLHKHPDRVQEFDLTFGKAHVFYPEVTDGSCTAALLLDVDPIGLVRGRHGKGDASGPLAQYVNDRPYAASSFLSVAIARVFGSALSGNCKQRPELVDEVQPLTARIAVLPSRGGEAVLRRLFEPLGYRVEAVRQELDPEHPEWGASPYYTVELEREATVKELLSHIYVLTPVLDDAKHYFIGRPEIDKLLRHGEGWLREHPAREEIALRYLRRQKSLARIALERLHEDDGEGDRETGAGDTEHALERPLSLNQVRVQTVHEALRDVGAQRVVDLGCGEGKLLQRLLRDKHFVKVVGMDTQVQCLEWASSRLKLDEMAPRMRERIELIHGSLTYRDERLDGFDAATLVEVIEHVDESRLAALERVVFEFARPGAVVVTTPNREYNARFDSLAPGAMRHADHRFEWTRREFQEWANGVCDRRGYAVKIASIGEKDPEVGAPTQMAVFRR